MVKAQIPGPIHFYAQRKLAEDVRQTLTVLIGDRGTIQQEEINQSYDLPIVKYSIIANGQNIGSVVVGSSVKADLLPVLDDVTEKLTDIYSEQKCQDMKDTLKTEYGTLKMQVIEKVNGLPTLQIKKISGLEKYASILRPYTNGNVYTLHNHFGDKAHDKDFMVMLEVDEPGLDMLKTIVNDYLGPEILSLEKRLKD